MIPVSYVAIKKKIEKQFGGEAVLRMAVKKAVSNSLFILINPYQSLKAKRFYLFIWNCTRESLNLLETVRHDLK